MTLFKWNLSKTIGVLCICAFTPVFAARYVSAEIGSFGVQIENHSRLYSGVALRFAGGHLQDNQKKLKTGFESGINFYQSKNYDLYNCWACPAVNRDDFSYTRISADLLGVLNYRVFCKGSVFAKVGPSFAINKTYEYVEERQTFIQGSIGGVVPKMVLGIGYDISPKINLNYSVNHEFGRGKINSGGSANLGFKYSFDA